MLRQPGIGVKTLGDHQATRDQVHDAFHNLNVEDAAQWSVTHEQPDDTDHANDHSGARGVVSDQVPAPDLAPCLIRKRFWSNGVARSSTLSGLCRCAAHRLNPLEQGS